MAEVHQAPKPPDTAGTAAATRPETHGADERRDRPQDPGLDVLNRATEPGMQGKDVAEGAMSTPTKNLQGTAEGPETPAAGGQRLWDTGQELRDKAQESVTHGKDVADEYYDEGRGQIHTWQQRLEQQVRRNPLQAVLLAGGLGLLVGLLKRR